MNLLRTVQMTTNVLIALFIRENKFDDLQELIYSKNLADDHNMIFNIFVDTLKHEKTGEMCKKFLSVFEPQIKKVCSKKSKAKKLFREAFAVLNIDIIRVFIKERLLNWRKYEKQLQSFSPYECKIISAKWTIARGNRSEIVEMLKDEIVPILLHNSTIIEEQKHFFFMAENFDLFKIIFEQHLVSNDVSLPIAQKFIKFSLKMFLWHFNIEGMYFLLQYFRNDVFIYNQIINLLDSDHFLLESVFYNAMIHQDLLWIQTISKNFAHVFDIKNVRFDGTNCGDALHFACENNLYEVVKFLVDDCGFDIQARNLQGETPIEIANLQKNYRVVHFLYERTTDKKQIQKFAQYFQNKSRSHSLFLPICAKSLKKVIRHSAHDFI